MYTIFVGGISTDRFAMGSSEPLGAPSPPAEYGTDSQESETIIIDVMYKPFSAPPTGGKRKRGALAEDELQAFTCMTEAVKDVTQAIRENKPTDVHPDLYKAVIDEDMTHRVLMFSIPGINQRGSPLEGYLKPARPNTPTWSRRQETPCKP
jgi:hypothetical protein